MSNVRNGWKADISPLHSGISGVKGPGNPRTPESVFDRLTVFVGRWLKHGTLKNQVAGRIVKDLVTRALNDAACGRPALRIYPQLDHRSPFPMIRNGLWGIVGARENGM